jgi:hypothetical protein
VVSPRARSFAKQIEWNEFVRKVNEAIARRNALVSRERRPSYDHPSAIAQPRANNALLDPRRRSAILLFSGRRTPMPIGEPRRIALDITALMVLGWLGLLPRVLSTFPEVVLPAGVFHELFEGRQRIRQYQKSRLHRAMQIRDAIARGKLKVLRSPGIVRDSLTNEIGIELSALIREASARNGIVLRPAPVHQLGIEGRDADMSPYAEQLADVHSLLAVLSEQNAINEGSEVGQRLADIREARP